MTHQPESSEQMHPPQMALRLLELVLPEREQDSVIGDLMEEYEALLQVRCVAAARRWLWWQALHSIVPILGRRVARAVRQALFAAESFQLQTVTEGANMFEKSMLEGSGARLPRRRWWAVPTAVGLHLFLVAGLAITRAWSLEELPAPVVQEEYIPVSLPPPPPAHGVRKPHAPRPAGTKPHLPPVTVKQPVAVPQAIPEPVAPEVAPVPEDLEIPDSAFDGPGEPGGSPNGVPGGTPGGTGTQLGPIEVKGEVRPPQLIRKIEPHYTPLARASHLQGAVIIEATIDKQGNVIDIRVVHGLGAGLTEEGVRAVEQWKWKPATLNGRPVTVYFTVTVNFTLHS
jgi:periplasmic protein TonB